TPGMRRPVRRITVPLIASRRMAFGEPTSPLVSGVMVAALRPRPEATMAAAASRTTALCVARRLASDRSNGTNSVGTRVTSGDSTRRLSSSSSWPVWSPPSTTIVRVAMGISVGFRRAPAALLRDAVRRDHFLPDRIEGVEAGSVDHPGQQQEGGAAGLEKGLAVDALSGRVPGEGLA